MFGLGTTEIIIIAVILLLLFGGKKIPEFIKRVTGTTNDKKNRTVEEVDESEDNE